MPPSRLALRLATLVEEFTLNGGCPLPTCRLSAVPEPELVTLSMEPLVFPVRAEVALTVLVLPRRKGEPTPRAFAAAVIASTAAAPAAPAMSPLPKLSCIRVPILTRHGALSRAVRCGQDETRCRGWQWHGLPRGHAPARCASSAARNCSAWSRCGPCPESWMTVSRYRPPAWA